MQVLVKVRTFGRLVRVALEGNKVEKEKEKNGKKHAPPIMTSDLTTSPLGKHQAPSTISSKYKECQG